MTALRGRLAAWRYRQVTRPWPAIVVLQHQAAECEKVFGHGGSVPEWPSWRIVTDEERDRLTQIDERGSDWRERRRARTVLLLDKGLSIDVGVTQQKIHKETVACHRDAWLVRGFAGLRDLPRTGAPRKLSVAHRQVLGAWAQDEARTAPQLRSRLSEERAVQVPVWRVQSALKEKGNVWKGTRHSLKKRDEAKFREAQAERGIGGNIKAW